MFIDIVFPSGNEEEFIEFGKKLDCNGLIFLYEKFDKKVLDKVKKLNSSKFSLYTGLVADKQISKKGFDLVFSKGSRAHFENKNVDYMFSLEDNNKKDSMHFRSSGLDQVLCKLAFEKNMCVCFSFNDILKSNKRELLFGRMMQNVKFCRKYKVEMLVASFARNPYEMKFWKDLISFGVCLGMHFSEAKGAVLNRKV